MRFVDPDRFATLKATGKLPSPKGLALAIIRLLQKEDFRIAELVQLVQSDPAIAGRVLYFANAAAFGRSRPIVSLQRAIVALGSFRVRDLVIGLSVMQDHRNGQCGSFDYEVFWAHSLATGIASQELANVTGLAAEEIFTIGLLARIGELALASVYPIEYDAVLKTPNTLEKLEAEEHSLFGLTHRELGASLLCEWGMPEMLAEAAFHHEQPDASGFPDGSRTQTLTYALSFASGLASLCLANEELRWSLLPVVLARAARLGLGGESLNRIVDHMVERWCDWGSKLHIRTQKIPPFEEILSAAPPVRQMMATSAPHARTTNAAMPACNDTKLTPAGQNGNARPRLRVQLIGIPLHDLPPLMQQIERFGHQPVLSEESGNMIVVDKAHPPEIVIADLATNPTYANDFCKRLRQTAHGKESYILFLVDNESSEHVNDAGRIGADDVLIKPVNDQALRAHLNLATRMRSMRDEIHRERLDTMRSTDEFALAQKRLLQDALTDPLTQLPNRRKGLDFLATELIYSRTTGVPVACMMIDIDYFKVINDTHGHAAGDAILRQLGRLLRQSARSEDLVFRFGGEEFVAILTRAGEHSAHAIAERLRLHVEKTNFKWQQHSIHVTISIGLAVAKPAMDSQALIEAADVALYQAKNSGRNCTVIWRAPAPAA